MMMGPWVSWFGTSEAQIRAMMSRLMLADRPGFVMTTSAVRSLLGKTLKRPIREPSSVDQIGDSSMPWT